MSAKHHRTPTRFSAADTFRSAEKKAKPVVKSRCKEHDLVCEIRAKRATIGDPNSSRLFLVCPLKREEGSCGFQRWIGFRRRQRRADRSDDEEEALRPWVLGMVALFLVE